MDARYLDRLAGHQANAGMQPFCLACGYDLRGSPSSRCPECGEVFNRREWEREMRDSLHQIGEAEESVQFVWLGLIVAGVGIVARGLGVLFPAFGVGSWIGRLSAIICGLAACALSLSVFRARQLAPWARARMKHRPNYWVAGAACILGASLLTTGVLFSW